MNETLFVQRHGRLRWFQNQRQALKVGDDKADVRWILDAGRLNPRLERGVGLETSNTQACKISKTRACEFFSKQAISKRTKAGAGWAFDGDRLVQSLEPVGLSRNQQ